MPHYSEGASFQVNRGVPLLSCAVKCVLTMVLGPGVCCWMVHMLYAIVCGDGGGFRAGRWCSLSGCLPRRPAGRASTLWDLVCDPRSERQSDTEVQLNSWA